MTAAPVKIFITDNMGYYRSVETLSLLEKMGIALLELQKVVIEKIEGSYGSGTDHIGCAGILRSSLTALWFSHQLS